MDTIKKFNKGPDFLVWNNSKILLYEGRNAICVTWEDPVDVGGTTWVSTKLVRKIGSAPTDSSDGTLVITTDTTKNQYHGGLSGAGSALNNGIGYGDTGLTAGTTYYYRLFAVDNYGREFASDSKSCVADTLCSSSYLNYVTGAPYYLSISPYVTNASAVVTELNLYPSDYYTKFSSSLTTRTVNGPSGSKTFTNVLLRNDKSYTTYKAIRYNGSTWEEVGYY